MQAKTNGISNPSLRKRYEQFRAREFKLDLTRGKPSNEQLALSQAMLADQNVYAADGSDCRNYGYLEGLPEARRLFGEYLGIPAEHTFVLGNSSLALMHDLVVQTLLHTPKIRPAMICPVPGYDRHHAICEKYRIKMLPVPLTNEGPDMGAVEKILMEEPVMGIWCVPKYSNPSGITYSGKVCRQLATLKARRDFRIFWDLAYQVHDLTETPDELPNMFNLCGEARNEDRVFIIGSTSKITFASAGLAILAASKKNLEWFRQGLSVQTIGPDKLNQLRHVRFLKDMKGIRSLMAQNRRILKPKFDAVDEILTRELGGKGIASWNKPRGGYFVSLQVKRGCAKKVVALATDIGIKLTPAGAAFPHDKDPDDSHIRIAPTFPPLEEVRQAMEIVALCIQIAAGT